jgi:hypothetical protein
LPGFPPNILITVELSLSTSGNGMSIVAIILVIVVGIAERLFPRMPGRRALGQASAHGNPCRGVRLRSSVVTSG